MSNEKKSNFRKFIFPGKFNKNQQLQKSLEQLKNDAPEVPTAKYHETLAKCYMEMDNLEDAQKELVKSIKLWKNSISQKSECFKNVEYGEFDNLKYCYWNLIQNAVKLKQDEFAAMYAMEACYVAKDNQQYTLFEELIPYALNGTMRVDALKLLIMVCIEQEQYERALHETDHIWMITLKEKNNRRGGYEFDPTLRDCELITMCILIFQMNIEKSARHEQLLNYYTTIYKNMEEDEKIALKYSDLPTQQRRIFKQFLLHIKSKDLEKASSLLPKQPIYLFNRESDQMKTCTIYYQQTLTICKMIFRRICSSTLPDI